MHWQSRATALPPSSPRASPPPLSDPFPYLCSLTTHIDTFTVQCPPPTHPPASHIVLITHTNTQANTHKHTHSHTHTNTQKHTHKHTQTSHTQIHRRTHTNTHTRTHTQTHTHTNTHTNTHTQTHVHHTHDTSERTSVTGRSPPLMPTSIRCASAARSALVCVAQPVPGPVRRPAVGHATVALKSNDEKLDARRVRSR